MDTKSIESPSKDQDTGGCGGISFRAGWGATDLWKEETHWGEQYLPSHTGISEYWRKNISSEESTELANVLRALRKVAGHIGQNVGEIEWTGMSGKYRGAISLDPGLVMGDYPVPSGKVDYLIGCVVHEALHKTEWSDLVWEKIEQYCRDVRVLEKLIIHKIVYAGEDIYIDNLSEQSILGLYTRKSREVALKKRGKGSINRNVTVDELFFLWWLKAVEGKIDYSINPAYEELLNALESSVSELKEVSQKSKHVTVRCEMRFGIYIDIWEKVKDKILTWGIDDKTLLWTPPMKQEEKKKRGRKKAATDTDKSPLSPALVNQIETTLAANSTDITPIIESIVGDDVDDVIPTSVWDFNIPSHPVIDPVLVGRLKAIFQNYSERKCMISRGLVSGRVDRRRLYRAPITGRCFMDRQSIPDMNWNICLLVDATGSMRGAKWRLVESTVANLHRAFIGFNNRLQAFAYFESDHICIVSRLIKGENLLSVPPSGQTASGQALIAAAYMMLRDKNRKLLIHITDGESNYGCNVQHGIDYCKSQNIDLITLACGYKDKEAMLNQYGKAIQFIDHFAQMPSALENLLRWIMVYGGKGRDFKFKTDTCDREAL